MSVGFGFSAGDFIAALQLTRTVIDCLRESSAAGASYRELLAQLRSLETALVAVESLEVEESQQSQKIAVEHVAAQCRHAIDDLWQSAQKYHPHLRGSKPGLKLREGWAKIEWTLLMSDDVEKFKRDIQAHTDSINILLTALHLQATTIHQRDARQREITLAGRIQSLTTGWTGYTRRHDLHSPNKSENLSMIFDIHQLMFRIPAQVYRQQPVYLIDAFGLLSPFHLEFIRSPEALVSVLRSNISIVPHAEIFIDHGDFVIQDEGTQKDIDLSRRWELCFSPGQRVSMSIVLDSPYGICPSCSRSIPDEGSQQKVCRACGTTLLARPRSEESRYLPKDHWSGDQPQLEPRCAPEPSAPKNGYWEQIPDISRFRRIRLIGQTRLYEEGSFAPYPRFSDPSPHELHMKEILDRQLALIEDTSDFIAKLVFLRDSYGTIERQMPLLRECNAILKALGNESKETAGRRWMEDNEWNKITNLEIAKEGETTAFTKLHARGLDLVNFVTFTGPPSIKTHVEPIA
ncbi:hypothetical protein GGR57DRAFT_512443 [Xylariaceae sp. FL1272]|nr:hypothetical protein GGR57DRAFT_512443 [Xylariaceae sp. FL1272]